jgi:hypothetical protein
LSQYVYALEFLLTIIQTLFAGVSAVFNEKSSSVDIAIAIRDTVYSLDYATSTIDTTDPKAITNHVIQELSHYGHNNMAKFIGTGVPHDLVNKNPDLCSRLWLESDIVPIVLNPIQEKNVDDETCEHWDAKSVDEQADSLARKCIM